MTVYLKVDSQTKAFTQTYDGFELMPKVDIIAHSKGRHEYISGIFDTGATNTCISCSLAEKLCLSGELEVDMSTPGGNRKTRSHCVDIILPNTIGVKDAVVLEADIDQQDIDMIVGMDIILLGKLSVGHADGKTSVSFEVPSGGQADLTGKVC